jgi:flagellar biosynthetic protein FlhB
MAEQDQHRPEQATPYKLAEARKQGQVAKSTDFNAFVTVCALLAVIVARGDSIAGQLANLSVSFFQASGATRLEQPADAAWLGQLLLAALALIAPFALVAVLSGILANLVQTGPVLSFAPVKPKFERIHPLEGFKRIFSKRMLFEAFKTLLKLALFSTIVYGFLRGLWPGLPALATGDTGTKLAWLATEGKSLLARLGLALLVIGLLDLAYTRWQFGKQMMMSRREVKEESKRREGDPHVRAKLRELQRENLKQARSLSRVPEADVLITNPEHFAIALKYVRGAMSAPKVIAKGANGWAVSMKAIARASGVPLYERRQLARSLFRHARLDQPIPPDSFIDVARVYAEVEAGRRRVARYEVAR